MTENLFSKRIDGASTNVVDSTSLDELLKRSGRFHDHIQSMSQASAMFREHVALAPNWWWHLVYLVIEVREWDVAREPEKFGELLSTTPAQCILRQTLGNAPNGLLQSLKKLRKHPLPTGQYRAFSELFDDRRSAKIIQHLRAISPDKIEVLLGLPRDVHFSGLIKCIETPGDAYFIRFVFQLLQQLVSRCELEAMAAALKNVSQLDAVGKWADRCFAQVTFPFAPWEGNDSLRPIVSFAELEVMARTFDNCVKDYLLPVLAGDSYFYEWTGGLPAIVRIRNNQRFGWIVTEIQGMKNREDFPYLVRDDICEQFSVAGIVKAPVHRYSSSTNFELMDSMQWVD